MSRRRKYPFHELAPGESVLVAWPDGRPPCLGERLGMYAKELTPAQQLYRKLAAAAAAHGRVIGARYSVRATTAGIRIICRERDDGRV